MSAAGFRGRGLPPRGRNIRGLPGGVMGARNPQPNFNQPRREGPLPPSPAEFWLEHSPAVPWQQMNGHPGPPQQFSGFEHHRYRGRPPFCSGIGARGRSKRIRGEGRPRLGVLPASGFGGPGLPRPDPEPARFAPLGSEEERQQKIAETADKLKQKLSSLTVGAPVNFWEDDLSGVDFSHNDEHVTANRGIPELRHDPPELNLTVNDLKDIGRVDPDGGLNSGDCVDGAAPDNEKGKVQGTEELNLEETGNWQTSVNRNHFNPGEDGNELLNNVEDDDTPRGKEIIEERIEGHGRRDEIDRENDPQSGETDQGVNYASVQKKKLPPSKLTEEQMSSVIGRAAAKVLEKKTNSDMKPELTKSLEKLREVIKVDRELEKEAKSSAHNEGRTIFQPNSGPRLQPDVRLDFHPGIAPGYPRFQDFNHPAGPHEVRGRYRGPFRPEHGMEMQPNFPQDFQNRFDYRPDPASRNFNLPPRILHSEFQGGRNQDIQQLQSFDPREPPPRFNQRQEHSNNQHWFGRNEFGPPTGINGLQPPPGFDPRGPPPRFMNQDPHELPSFGHNMMNGQEFPPIVPMGYPQAPHIHLAHSQGYFHPTLPPQHVIPKFQPPVPIPGLENQIQPPPMPVGALELQSQILRRPPSPPGDLRVNDNLILPNNDNNPTPNMNEELEDMQEALEFAKKLMNMTEEEKEEVQEFDMPTFPDLPPIPSTEPSHLEDQEDVLTSIQTEEEIPMPEENKLGPVFGPQNFIDDSTKPMNPKPKEVQVQEESKTIDDLIRPKVTFNLNSRSKIIPQTNEWKQQNDASSSNNKEKISSREKASFVSSKSSDKEEKTEHLKSKEGKNNRKNKSSDESRDSQLSLGDRTPKQKENKAVAVSVEVSSKVFDDVANKTRASSSSSKSLSAATVDANWKDKVINQFLKMSKNDICNMVNSSGLRKFDIAMKHLVKERKYSLAQERRSSADDAVKGTNSACYSSSSSSSYDMSREEFMSQLSAMLDPSATVDVNNLPSKFIQHLSEVLKLDVRSHFNETSEPVIEEENRFDNPEYAEEEEEDNCELQNFADYALENSDLQLNQLENQSPVINLKTEIHNNEEIQVPTKFNNFFDNGNNNSVPEILPNMNVIDDIFSEGIARAKQGQKIVAETKGEEEDEKTRDIEGEFISHGLIRARCTRSLMSEENIDLDDIFSAEIPPAKETLDSQDVFQPRVETAAEVWGRRKFEDPDMFRNLTKEEWEARCGRASDFQTDTQITGLSWTPEMRETSVSAKSHSPRRVDKSLNKNHRNLSPPTPLREANHSLNTNCWPETAESETLAERESDSEASSSSASSNEDHPNSPKVSKLLKVIKQREKIAKDISLGDGVREEIRAKGRDRESDSDRKSRKREKNKRRRERREKKKARRKRRNSFEQDDEQVEITSVNNSVKQQEAFVKQEELIIEADNEPVIPEQMNPNSQSTVERNEETMSEISFHEHNETPLHVEGTFSAREKLVAREYASPLTLQELKAESLSHDTRSPLTNFSAEHSEPEGSMSAENSMEKFELKQAKTTLSKSGAKKIDIEAYKARKLHRNNEKRDKSKETVEPALNILPQSEETAKETPKEKISQDLTPRGKDRSIEDKRNVVIDEIESKSEKDSVTEKKTSSGVKDGSNKDKRIDFVDGIESESKKDSESGRKTSSAQAQIKEKSSVTKEKSDKKEERRSSKEKKGRTTSSDDKVEKKLSRSHSRDSERTSFRDEESRRRSKERSKRHHSSARSNSHDKTVHQNNNVVESSERKSSRHKTCDSITENNEKIEKRHSKSKKNSSEEKSEGTKETKRRSSSRQLSPGVISDKIVTDGRKEETDELPIVKNCEVSKESADITQTHEPTECSIETDKVSSLNLDAVVTETNVSGEAGQAAAEDTKTTDRNDVNSLLDQKLPLERDEEETEELEKETDLDKAEKDAEKDSSSEQNQSSHNETENRTAPDLEASEIEAVTEFQQTEAVALESIEKSTIQVAEETLEDILSELEPKEPCENDIKTLLNDLLEKAILQLDSLNGKNEAKETIEPETCTELGFPTENEHGFREFIEYNTLELNSPQTPESPLKGFTEESIKCSILGKRRLAQSVLEISEDYMLLNKRLKDSDNVVRIDTIIEEVSPLEDTILDSLNGAKETDPVLGKVQIEALDGLQSCVSPEVSELKALSHEDETCLTPSGDTLSLDSSIDFDNGEFIVLSEISSDEDFSQDEGRKSIVKGKPNSHKIEDTDKPITEPESREKESASGAFSADKSTTKTLLKNRKDRKSEGTHSKLRICIKDSEIPPITQETNDCRNSELEPNLSRNDNNNADDVDPAANVMGETVEQSGLVRLEETKNLNKQLENENLGETLSCKEITKKTEEDSGRKKNSESKKPSSKSDEQKSGKSSLSKDVSSSGKHGSSDNLHRIKHRHKMKHKKEKSRKPDEKHIKDTMKDQELVTVVKKQHTKEGVMARMIEIDLEIQKLMSEKMKLYQMLESGELPTEQALLLLAREEHAEPTVENSNTSHQSSNTGTSMPSTKQKSSSSGNSSHQKSSKITTSSVSADDSGNRHGSSHKDKKSKKSHKPERPSRPDSAAQNESKKPPVDAPVESKSSISKRKQPTEDKSSSSKKESHSRSSSSSTKRKDEESHSSRKEEVKEHSKKIEKISAKETPDEECQKSKKTEKKKTNKTPESKDDNSRRIKKEEQLFGPNDEPEQRSRPSSEARHVTPDKQLVSQIYSDESSQVSLAQEYSGGKKASKGLALLEETYNRERALSKKRRAALCKRKKDRLKTLQKSTCEALSPSEEEMPLDLLYSKKFLKKKEPVNNSKSKSTISNKVLEHVLETINAVAENKIEEYHRPSKAKAQTQGKVTGRSKTPHEDSPHSEPDESFANLWHFEDDPSSLAENLSEDDFRDLNEIGNVTEVLGPETAALVHGADDKFPIDKIVEISRENNGPEIVTSKSLFGVNIYEGEIDGEISHVDNAQITCRQWNNDNDILRLNQTASTHTLDYLNDIEQYGNSDSAFIPQDQTSHSHSISRNLDIEKGLDVLDSMLETVGGNLEGVSPKEVHSGFVKRGKRRRIISGEGGVSARKRKTVSVTDMMNCSVRLVDCKYTYLRHCWNSGAAQRFTICSVETAQPNATSLKQQNSAESHPRTPKSKSPVLPQAVSDEPPDWPLKDVPLMDCDDNLPPLSAEQFLIPGTDLSLNNIGESFPYDDDDDLEIMKLHPSNCPDNVAVSDDTENWQSLEKIHADDDIVPPDCGPQTIVTLDIEPVNTPLAEISMEENLSAHELRPRTKPSSSLGVAQGNQQQKYTDLGDVGILEAGINAVGEEEGAAAECRDDVQVIDPPKDQHAIEVEEVELPRIQYSVHKGPILDVKVFGDSILAASEDGVIYRYSQTCNGILNTYEGHKSAVTCIHVMQTPPSSRDLLFSSSLDGSLRCFDITTSHQVRGAADVGSPVQCMDQSWGTIFLGTKSGYVFRFHIKSHAFKGDEIKFSEESVLALKATTEGPRRVLIVASRSQPITIRDAQSGLFLRTVSGHKSHTVYSLMMNSNLVYCGTSSTAIPVFDFINGSQVKLYNAGPGIVCMRMYKLLLFAGCYDGNIYVFDTKEERLVCSIPGPGNMLLSMDIVKNKIVAGSKDRRLHIWQMPDQVLTLLADRT